MKKRFISIILTMALLFGNVFAFTEGDIENNDTNNIEITETVTPSPEPEQAPEPDPAPAAAPETTTPEPGQSESPVSDAETTPEAAPVSEPPADNEPSVPSDPADNNEVIVPSETNDANDTPDPAETNETNGASGEAETIEPTDNTDTTETSGESVDPEPSDITENENTENQTAETEDTEETSETEPEDGEPAEEPGIDYSKSVKDNELFNKGYVTFGSAELYETEYDTQAYGRLSGGIAYASRRVNKGTASDRLLISFATEEGISRAYVKSSAARPLSDEAFAAFKAGFDRLPANEKVFYNNDTEMPLQILSLTVYETEAAEDEPDPEQPGNGTADGTEPENNNDINGDGTEPVQGGDDGDVINPEPNGENNDGTEPEANGDDTGDGTEPDPNPDEPGDGTEPVQGSDAGDVINPEPNGENTDGTEPETNGDDTGDGTEPDPNLGETGDGTEPVQGGETGDEIDPELNSENTDGTEPENNGEGTGDETEPDPSTGETGDGTEPVQGGDAGDVIDPEPTGENTEGTEPENNGEGTGESTDPEMDGEGSGEGTNPELSGDGNGEGTAPEQLTGENGEGNDPDQPTDENGEGTEPEQNGEVTGEIEGELPVEDIDEAELSDLTETEFEERFDSFSLNTQLRMLSAFAPKSGFRFSKAYMFMGRGDEVDLTELLIGSGVFALDENSAASLIGNVFRALAEGHATVRATNDQGKTAKIVIYVVREPSALAFEKTAYTVAVGSTITPAYSFDRNISTHISWSSSNEAVATADNNGTITALMPGTAVISIESYNGLRANLALSVLAEPEDLTLSLTEAELSEGGSVDVHVSFTGDVFGDVQAINASGDGIVEITKNGDFDFTVTAVASGEANIEFSVTNSTGETYSETLTLTIDRAVRSIALLNNVTTLGRGETVDIQPVALDGRGEVIEDEALTIQSSATGNVQIKSGKLYARNEGKSTITIKAANGITKKFTAKVVAAPSSVKLSAKSLKLTLGENETISYSIPKGSASQVTWASSDENVFTLSDIAGTSIKVNAVGEGTAVLSIRANAGGKTARINVTVVPVPTEILLNADEFMLEENTAVTAAVTGYLPEGAWAKAVEFETADTSIAEVSAEGVITGKRMGETTLTARVTLSGGIVEKTVPVRVIPVAISIDAPATIKLGRGEIVTVEPGAYDRFGEPVPTTFTLKSSDTNGFKVSGMMIKGANKGTFTLKITSKAGVVKNISIKVVDAPTKISLSNGKLNLEEGMTHKLTYSFSPKGAYSRVTWSSSDESVAAVSADGTVTAVAPGTAVITAQTFVGKVKASCTVTVYPHVETIQFTESTITIYEGQTAAPEYSVAPEESFGMVALEYGEGLEEIASVDKTAGTVKGLQSGTGTLRAVSQSGNVATVQIEVLPAPARIAFEYKRTKLGKGETVDIKPVAYDARNNKLSNEDWPIALTSNSTYLTINEDGTVTGRSIGTSTVTATASNGVKASYKIEVIGTPAYISFNATKLTLNIGASATLKATWEKQTMIPTWTSSDADVADVDENGVVTAMAAGTATITARSYNGKTAKCTITVKPFPEAIAFENEEYTVGEGRTITPKLILTPSNSGTVIAYTIEDVNGETLAAVNENGVVSGLLSGDAVLVATATNPVTGETLTASAQLHIIPAAVEIVVEEDAGHLVANDIFYIGIGEKITLDVTLKDGRGNVIETSPAVATTNGKILKKSGLTFTGVAKGNASFKITLDNGTVYQRKVQVYDAVTGITGLVSEFNRVAGNPVETTFGYKKGFGGVTAESSDETVATASVAYTSGALTLSVNTVAPGSAVITLRTFNNKVASCNFNVYDAVPEISFEGGSAVQVSSGSKYKLIPVLTPEGNWGEITFSVDDETIATVDQDGTVHAIKEGTATVTANCAGGSGQCEVTVIGTLTELDLNLDDVKKGVGQKGYENSSATLLKLGKGESVTIHPATYIGEEEVLSSYTYKTSDKKIATVNANGTVKGVSEGKTTITVSTEGGMRASFTVQVMSAPDEIKLPAKLYMQVGGDYGLNPKVNSKRFGRVTWKTNNPNVVTVDEFGGLHAAAPGTAKIMVTTFNKKSAIVTVYVNSAPESIAFAKGMYDVAFGEGQQVSTSIVTEPAGRAISVSYQIIPDDAEMGEFASVDAKGVVTGLSEGTGRLVATVYDWENEITLTAETMIVVHKAVASIGFTKSTNRIGYHEYYTLQPVAYDADGEPVDAPITVKSSDGNVVKVSGSVLYGKNTGDVTISVFASNGNTSVKKTFKLKVLTAPSKIAIAQGGNIILTINEVKQLTANSNNVSNVQVTWTSDAPEVASVSEDGVVTAHSLGTAKITARNYNGKQASTTINVCPEAEDIFFPVSETLLGEGGTRTIKAQLPENTGGIITYHSVNPLVAQVDPVSGLVTAVKKGQTGIVATIYNSTTGQYYTAQYDITVEGAPVTIQKVYGVTSIAVGEKDVWQFKLYDADGEETGSDLAFSSSKKDYVTVNGAGQITGKVVGESVITVKAYNGTVLKVKVKCYRAPGSVGLNSTNVTISEMETFQLSPKFPGGTVSKVTYSSSAPEIADVDINSGLITAHEVGTAVVTVKTFNNKTARCQVTVLPEPDGIDVNISELILNEDGVYTGFHGLLNTGHKGVITYVSSDEAVASVDPDTGVITAHQAGECVITACTTNRRTGEQYSAGMNLTVIRIVLSTDRTSVGINEILNYSAVAYDKDGNVINCDIRPATSNKSIVAVSDYRIKGIKAGSATITMRAIGDAFVARTIKVIAAPTSISLSASNNKLTVGYGSLKINYTLKANGAVSAINWTSSDTSVATVDANGYVLGVAPGTVRITAKTYNNKSANIDLTVFNPPESIRLNKPSVTMGVGQKETLVHYFNDGEFSEVTYTSSDENVVSVAANGQLTAVAEGSAVITVTTFNGKSATCQVTVNPAPTSVHFTMSTLVLGRGQTYDLSNLVQVDEGTTASYTFAVENKAIITKSGASGIYGKANGTTRAKVTTHNGKSAIITVKVQTAATIFTVEKNADVMFAGDTVTFSAVMPNGSAANVVFTSDNPDVVSISSSGTANCLAVGEATIVATAGNGLVVKTKVYVYSHVSSVELEAPTLSIQHYDSYTLGVAVLPESAYDRSVTWSSSDPDKVSVGPGGKITALALSDGPVTITAASVDGDVQDQILVTVLPVSLESFELSVSEIALERDRSVKVNAEFTPANADEKSLVWSSDNENVAVVDQFGNISAVSDSGNAVITCVSNDGGFIRTVTVTATKVQLQSASADDPAPQLVHYETMALVPVLEPADADVNMTWSVSNPAIASVDENGTVTGLEVGTTNVSAAITDYFGHEFTVTYSVTVTPVTVTGIELSATASRLRVGGQEVFEYTVTPENADNKAVILNVSAGGVVSAELTQDGEVTVSAIKAGTTTVSVITVDQGFESVINVEVFDNLTVSATPNLAVTTTNNTINWLIDSGNAIGEVAYQITVQRDGTQVLSQTSYDPAAGISLTAAANGDYELNVVITDVDGQTATATSTVTVSDTITYAENGNVWEYVVTEVQGQTGASVKLKTLASDATAVSIPKTMNGAAVLRIDTEAFKDMSSIVSVQTPETVTEIGARAFKGCTALASMSTY